MYIDRIDLSLPQEDFQSVLEAFASAAATLQIIEVGRTHRHLIPAGMDFEKIDRDLAAREQLRVLKILLQNLLDRVSDSMLLTGVDLYAAALSMYHCLRRNADTAGLKSTVAELKKGFARPSRKKKEQAQSPRPQPSASGGAPIRTAPDAAGSAGRRIPLPPVSDQTQLAGGAASLHFYHYALPVFFSGGFTCPSPEYPPAP